MNFSPPGSQWSEDKKGQPRNMRTDANGLTVYFPISFTATPFPITARGCARSGLPWGKALGISQPRSGLPIAVGYRCANAMRQPFQGRRSFWGAIPRVGRGASNPGLQEETALPFIQDMATDKENGSFPLVRFFSPHRSKLRMPFPFRLQCTLVPRYRSSNPMTGHDRTHRTQAE